MESTSSIDDTHNESPPVHSFQKHYSYYGDSFPNKKPDLKRREILARPTVRHLLASGFHAVKTRNEKVLSNLENMLCCQISDTMDPSMSELEWREYIDKFVEEHRPKSPVDPDVFTYDDLAQPIYYDTYERCRAQIIHRYQNYNFRGAPKPIADRVLNYTPTERILALSKPRQPRYAFGRTNSLAKLRSISVQRLNQRRRIVESELIPQGPNQSFRDMGMRKSYMQTLKPPTIVPQMIHPRPKKHSGFPRNSLKRQLFPSASFPQVKQRLFQNSQKTIQTGTAVPQTMLQQSIQSENSLPKTKSQCLSIPVECLNYYRQCPMMSQTFQAWEAPQVMQQPSFSKRRSSQRSSCSKECSSYPCSCLQSETVSQILQNDAVPQATQNESFSTHRSSQLSSSAIQCSSYPCCCLQSEAESRQQSFSTQRSGQRSSSPGQSSSYPGCCLQSEAESQIMQSDAVPQTMQQQSFSTQRSGQRASSPDQRLSYTSETATQILQNNTVPQTMQHQSFSTQRSSQRSSYPVQYSGYPSSCMQYETASQPLQTKAVPQLKQQQSVSTRRSTQRASEPVQRNSLPRNSTQNKPGAIPKTTLQQPFQLTKRPNPRLSQSAQRPKTPHSSTQNKTSPENLRSRSLSVPRPNDLLTIVPTPQTLSTQSSSYSSSYDSGECQTCFENESRPHPSNYRLISVQCDCKCKM